MSLMLLFSHLCGSEFILSSLHLLNLDSMHFHFRHTSWDTESWERDTRDALYGKGISEISALHRVFFSVFYSTHVIQKFLFNMLLFEFNFVCHSIWSGSIHTPLLVACFPFHTFSTLCILQFTTIYMINETSIWCCKKNLGKVFLKTI